MRWIIVVLVLACARAHAGTVGVIVAGDATVQSRLAASAERYLAAHGYVVSPGPLEPAATSTLLDCLALDDTGCARSLVDQKARTEIVLAVRTEIQKGEPREIRVVAYWMAKGHSAISGRKVCEKCTDAALDATFDAMLADLTGTKSEGPRELPHPRSRALPVLALGLGGAVLVTGIVLYATSESATGKHPTYRDTKNLGIGLAAGGAVLAGVGIWLLLRGGERGPMLEPTAGGATVSWIGRF